MSLKSPTVVTARSADSPRVSAKTRSWMPRATAAGIIIRASWPPPITPTVGVILYSCTDRPRFSQRWIKVIRLELQPLYDPIRFREGADNASADLSVRSGRRGRARRPGDRCRHLQPVARNRSGPRSSYRRSALGDPGFDLGCHRLQLAWQPLLDLPKGTAQALVARGHRIRNRQHWRASHCPRLR